MNLNVIMERGGANGTNELLPFLQERAEPLVSGDDLSQTSQSLQLNLQTRASKGQTSNKVMC